MGQDKGVGMTRHLCRQEKVGYDDKEDKNRQRQLSSITPCWASNFAEDAMTEAENPVRPP